MFVSMYSGEKPVVQSLARQDRCICQKHIFAPRCFQEERSVRDRDSLKCIHHHSSSHLATLCPWDVLKIFEDLLHEYRPKKVSLSIFYPVSRAHPSPTKESSGSDWPGTIWNVGILNPNTEYISISMSVSALIP